jgi:hypothetical protein
MRAGVHMSKVDSPKMKTSSVRRSHSRVYDLESFRRNAYARRRFLRPAVTIFSSPPSPPPLLPLQPRGSSGAWKEGELRKRVGRGEAGSGAKQREGEDVRQWNGNWRHEGHSRAADSHMHTDHTHTHTHTLQAHALTPPVHPHAHAGAHALITIKGEQGFEVFVARMGREFVGYVCWANHQKCSPASLAQRGFAGIVQGQQNMFIAQVLCAETVNQANEHAFVQGFKTSPGHPLLAQCVFQFCWTGIGTGDQAQNS